MENWTSSATPTWWTSPWTCTEAFIWIRTFPIVSVVDTLMHTHTNAHKAKERINIAR